MESSTFWTIAIIVVVIGIVIVAIIVEYNQPSNPTTSGGSSQGGTQPTLSQRHEVCTTTPCAVGLVCVRTAAGENRCLSTNGQPCFINEDCASGLCQGGVCITSTTLPAPPGNSTTIYCWNGSSWVGRVTIPAGITFNRIVAANGRLLGISTTGQVYVWNGNGWQNISSTFASPGLLIDGTITSNGTIYLVYRLNNGQTALYTVQNNVLVPVNLATGGLQNSITGQTIQISEIAVDSMGDIFLVGTTSGGQVSIYRANPGQTTYTPLTVGRNIYVFPNRNGNNFAFSEGSSILVIGDTNTRQDNVLSPITGVVVTPTNEIWYISNNQIYRNGTPVPTPVPVNPSTRLFYSPTDGVCFFTPGY